MSSMHTFCHYLCSFWPHCLMADDSGLCADLLVFRQAAAHGLWQNDVTLCLAQIDILCYIEFLM